MSKKASLVTHAFYNGNRIFNLEDPIVNRDNCLYSFFALKQAFAERGVDLATADIHPPQSSDIVLYNEMPEKLPLDCDIERSSLLLFETELIRPQNWVLKNHKRFHKVFTWNDDFVDNKRYFKINFSHLFPQNIRRGHFKDKKLCTLIAGRKQVSHPLELYSKRLEAIRWFETHHPDEFTYYGMGWGDFDSGIHWINKILKKLKLTRYLPSGGSRCYGGMVDSKNETLNRYKFSICYENARDIPGYITEKIFDCFFAGCIPVYWGAGNIDQFIDPKCYVDKRNFANYETLYQFLIGMSEVEFTDRLNAIDSYLKSDSAKIFRAECFAKTVVDQVV